VFVIEESKYISREAVEYFSKGDTALTRAMQTIIKELYEAKEYGSILVCSRQNWEALYNRFDEILEDISLHRGEALALLPLVQTAEALSQQYDVVVTNPPYMGGSGMSGKLSDYVKQNYPDSKSDLFAVFIERCGQMARQNGYQAMITQHAWMFLSSYEKLRAKLQDVVTVNMVHLGAHAFEEINGEVVQTTSFIFRRACLSSYWGTYCRLIEPTTQQGKEKMFLASENRYNAQQECFSKIPGAPVAYWVSVKQIQLFDNPALGKMAISDGQNITGNNERFLRYLWEVCNLNIGKGKKWVLCARGGAFRRWYGNIDEVIDWSDSARDYYRKDKISRIVPEYIRFRRGISWSRIASANIGFRLLNESELFEKTGVSVFPKNEDELKFLLALLNTCVTKNLMKLITQVITLQVRDVFSIPVLDGGHYKKKIEEIVDDCIRLSKQDWDAFETSWDFQSHPLLRSISTINEAYSRWNSECENRFERLKVNEEELNRIFIDIYGLQDELTPEIEDKDVTVRRADLQREIRSLISYAVGCMFGRYSLDAPGLVYAGGMWNNSKYETFEPDRDSIIPICDDEYFEDDIVGRFEKFIEVVYGKETLEENLRFIADALGGKGSSREVIRNYFINDFYADHLKVYQKRPIYWLFDSGKKNGFKCLIYMHRYQPDTIARVRTDYVHEQQSRYRTAIADLEQRINGASSSERVKLSKQLAKLQAQAEETRIYEEKIHHLADQMIEIDLDNGVKHNYAIFKDVLAKIK
jgi:hypothetical protein